MGVMATTTYAAVAFSELPGWADDDHHAALKAFQASCPRTIAGKGSAAKSGDTSFPPLQAACKAALALPPKVTAAQARAFFERHFQPHRVVHDAMEGLFTGYYEPILEGSRTKDARFQTPLLKRPPDLVTVIPETRGAAAGSLTHARQTAAGLVPFATRAEIEAGALAGQGLELLYLADPVDKFFLQVQGSGRVRLQDGTFVRVQYDGKNGHPYTSIGRYLIDQGLLAADKVSLGAISRWLKADVERARMVMNQNASYVFFREMPATAEGPLGAIEVPLIGGRSLAIDPGLHRLGSPIYVSVPTLKPPGEPRGFNRLMVAHDVGSAIRGPERGDIYFGSGKDAERAASGVRHPGNLFVLLANTNGGAPVAEAPGAGPVGR
jgi:membrane-bound lytic murein transglycosylase A